MKKCIRVNTHTHTRTHTLELGSDGVLLAPLQSISLACMLSMVQGEKLVRLRVEVSIGDLRLYTREWSYRKLQLQVFIYTNAQTLKENFVTPLSLVLKCNTFVNLP